MPAASTGNDPGEEDRMLKSIDPILNADVLRALRAMGHGDDLILCDTNFPADSVARANWLPAPEGQFALIVRAYVPTQPVQNGSY